MEVSSTAKIEAAEQLSLEAAQAPKMLHDGAQKAIEHVEQWAQQYRGKIERSFVVHRPGSEEMAILDIAIVRTTHEQDQELAEAEKHLQHVLQDSYSGISVEIYNIPADENALAFVLHASCNSSVERVQELTL